MPRPQCLFRTGVPQPLAAELAKGFEEPEAVGAVALSALEHGLLDERPDELRDVRAVQPVTGTHGLRRVQLEATGEHGQAGPQPPLLIAQELVAPVDRSLERLLAGRYAAVPGAERGEPGCEATIERIEAEGVEADRRQLERQRDAVDMGAHA